MRLLQFEPSELPPPSPHHASALGPTRMRVRAVWGRKSAPVPAAPHEINLVAQPLTGDQESAGVQLMVASTTGHGVGRLARPRWSGCRSLDIEHGHEREIDPHVTNVGRWPRTSPTIPSSYWTGDIRQVELNGNSSLTLH